MKPLSPALSLRSCLAGRERGMARPFHSVERGHSPPILLWRFKALLDFQKNFVLRPVDLSGKEIGCGAKKCGFNLRISHAAISRTITAGA